MKVRWTFLFTLFGILLILLGENLVKSYHPNVEGRSTVAAKDLCSPNKLIEAKVRVSRVMKIKVDSPEMVEVGKLLEMNVIALDR